MENSYCCIEPARVPSSGLLEQGTRTPSGCAHLLCLLCSSAAAELQKAKPARGQLARTASDPQPLSFGSLGAEHINREREGLKVSVPQSRSQHGTGSTGNSPAAMRQHPPVLGSSPSSSCSSVPTKQQPGECEAPADLSPKPTGLGGRASIPGCPISGML